MVHKYPDDPPPELREKASQTLGQTEFAVEIYNAVKDHELEFNRATAAFEHAALRPGIILNGGAAAAFVTLLGAVAKTTESDGIGSTIDFGWASGAIIVWTAGLVFAAVALGFGWHSQRSYTRYMKRQRAALEYQFGRDTVAAGAIYNDSKQDARDGKISQTSAFRCGILTYGAFVVGVSAALISILKG